MGNLESAACISYSPWERMLKDYSSLTTQPSSSAGASGSAPSGGGPAASLKGRTPLRPPTPSPAPPCNPVLVGYRDSARRKQDSQEHSVGGGVHSVFFFGEKGVLFHSDRITICQYKSMNEWGRPLQPTSGATCRSIIIGKTM